MIPGLFFVEFFHAFGTNAVTERYLGMFLKVLFHLTPVAFIVPDILA
jgi:hypothetical protein